MNKPTTLHRLLTLIRLLRRPYLYPTQTRLIQSLTNQGFSAVSARTLDRDKRQISREYGLDIHYSKAQKGYYLELPTDEDISDFEDFVSLLERRERLEFLTQSADSIHTISRYLSVERNDLVRGTEHLTVVWEALRGGRVLTFTYRSFAKPDAQSRRVEPGLLFEYRNRWYLDGFDRTANQVRTFGLDRMQTPELTGQAIDASRAIDYKTTRQHAIGVTCPPHLTPETVVLRFSPGEGQYVLSLPLHASQQVLRQGPAHIDVSLRVILNHELEREILSYGDEVEVLEPVVLRERIAGRVLGLKRHYEKDASR